MHPSFVTSSKYKCFAAFDKDFPTELQVIHL